MILYLDTSALIKLFISEIHSERVRAAAKGAKGLACSSLGYVETHAAFARLAREGLLPPAAHHERETAFDHAWKDFIVVEASTRLIGQAARLVVPHSLRGFDAVHLASALEIFHSVPKMQFACFDDRLSEASRNLGLEGL